MARSVVTTRVVAAPARRVWGLVSHPEDMARWRPTVDRVDMITDQPFGPGTRYRLTFEQDDGAPRPTEEVEVTTLQEGTLLTELHEMGRLPYQQLVLVVPHGDAACEVVVANGQAGTSLLDRAIGATAAVLDDSVRRVQATYLEDLARAVVRPGR